MKSLFWFLVAVVLKWTQAVPYGFGNVGSVRQVDAIVVEAAPSNPSDSNFQSPSFSPDSSYQSNPVQTPSCRYRVYYDQASKSSSESATGNTRQNVQSNYDTNQDYQPARYNSYQEYQPARYNSNQEYQQVREVVKSQYYSYSPSFRTPSASVESSNYYQQNNNDVQDVTNKIKHGPTGSAYEAFMVHQEYPTARVIMGYRQISSTPEEVKSSVSSYY